MVYKLAMSIAQYLDGTTTEPNYIISDETATMHKIKKIQMRKSDKHLVIDWEG